MPEAALHALEPFLPVAGVFAAGLVAAAAHPAARRPDLGPLLTAMALAATAAANLVPNGAPAPRAWTAFAVTLLWAARLVVHVARRPPPRGPSLKWSLPLLPVQAFVTCAASLPLLALVRGAETPWTWADLAAAVLWLAGAGLETVSDLQLEDFRSDSRGKLLTRGLRRYVRHPSYLGEVLMSWALWVACLSVPGGVVTILGPILVTLWFSSNRLLTRELAGRTGFKPYAGRAGALTPKLSTLRGAS